MTAGPATPVRPRAVVLSRVRRHSSDRSPQNAAFGTAGHNAAGPIGRPLQDYFGTVIMQRIAGSATWDQLDVGHRFTSRRYRIDEAMVREYCAALEIDAERYIQAGVVP